MAASGPFPLLVEGAWVPDPQKTLINKLQTYFQSRKKSGGGECEVVQLPESPASFLVLFSREDGEGTKAKEVSPAWGSGYGCQAQNVAAVPWEQEIAESEWQMHPGVEVHGSHPMYPVVPVIIDIPTFIAHQVQYSFCTTKLYVSSV
ncbi:hypothetical protein ACRRTK_018813 [Alexandromys fortis]